MHLGLFTALALAMTLVTTCGRSDEAKPESDEAKPDADWVEQPKPLALEVVEPSPSVPLDGYVVLSVADVETDVGGPDRIEFDGQQIYTETEAGFFRLDLDAKHPKPQRIALPDGFFYLGVHRDDLLFWTEPTSAVYAVPKAGGAPRLIVEFGEADRPFMVADSVIAFSTNALRSAPIATSTGAYSYLPIASPPEPKTRLGLCEFGVTWIGVDYPRQVIHVARPPFERVEVALQSSEDEVFRGVACAGDDSLIYIHLDRDNNGSIRRKSGARVEILLESVVDRDYLTETRDAAWWFPMSEPIVGLWRLGPDRHQFLSMPEPDYLDVSRSNIVWSDRVDGVWNLHRSGSPPTNYKAPMLRHKDATDALGLDFETGRGGL